MSFPYNFSFPFNHLLGPKDSRYLLCYGSIHLIILAPLYDRSLPIFIGDLLFGSNFNTSSAVNTCSIRRKRVPIFISPTRILLLIPTWCKERSFKVSLSNFFRTRLCLSELICLYPLRHISLILKYGTPPRISCGLKSTHDF